MDPLSWLKGKGEEEKLESDVSHQEKQINNPPEPEKEDKTLNIKNKVQEGRIYEPSDVTEKYRKAILGKKASTPHLGPHVTTQKESPATVFVIVYTILLLILGFIVYRDLTKRISKLDTKLENIEKQVESGFVNYEDAKFDEVW